MLLQPLVFDVKMLLHPNVFDVKMFWNDTILNRIRILPNVTTLCLLYMALYVCSLHCVHVIFQCMTIHDHY